MAYEKTQWVDGSAPDLSAANLNHIEQGIATNDSAVRGIQSAMETLNADLLSCTYQISEANKNIGNTMLLLDDTRNEVIERDGYTQGRINEVESVADAVYNDFYDYSRYTHMHAMYPFTLTGRSKDIDVDISWYNDLVFRQMPFLIDAEQNKPVPVEEYTIENHQDSACHFFRMRVNYSGSNYIDRRFILVVNWEFLTEPVYDSDNQ